MSFRLMAASGEYGERQRPERRSRDLSTGAQVADAPRTVPPSSLRLLRSVRESHYVVLQRDFHMALLHRRLRFRGFPAPAFALYFKRGQKIRQPVGAERGIGVADVKMQM